MQGKQRGWQGSGSVDPTPLLELTGDPAGHTMDQFICSCCRGIRNGAETVLRLRPCPSWSIHIASIRIDTIFTTCDCALITVTAAKCTTRRSYSFCE